MQRLVQLENFAGPLDLLLRLVKEEELDLQNISLALLARQYRDYVAKETLEEGPEFLSKASELLWLKSVALLPRHEQEKLDFEEEHELDFQVVYKLAEYQLCKEAATTLKTLEAKKEQLFSRGSQELIDMPKALGIEHISLNELAFLFQKALDKAEKQTAVIYEESYRLSEALTFLRKELALAACPIATLFAGSFPKVQLIVTFLAILELLKAGEVILERRDETLYLKTHQTPKG